MNLVWTGGSTLAAKVDTLTLKAAAKLAAPIARLALDERPCDCDGHPNCICEIADARYPMTHAEQLAAALDGR